MKTRPIVYATILFSHLFLIMNNMKLFKFQPYLSLKKYEK